MTAKILTFEEFLVAIGFPVADAKARLAALADKYPGLNPPINEVMEVISSVFTVDVLTSFKAVAAQELLTLLQTGASDISENTDDSGLV